MTFSDHHWNLWSRHHAALLGSILCAGALLSSADARPVGAYPFGLAWGAEISMDYHIRHTFQILTAANTLNDLPELALGYRANVHEASRFCDCAHAIASPPDAALIQGQEVRKRVECMDFLSSFPTFAESAARVTTLQPGYADGWYEVVGKAEPGAACHDLTAYAHADSWAQLKYRGSTLDRLGHIHFGGQWQIEGSLAGQTIEGSMVPPPRRIARDPIIARLTDLTTGVTNSYTLLSVRVSVGDGDFSWSGGVLSSTAANMTFDLSLGASFPLGGSVTSQQGTLHLEAKNGLVTSSTATGTFASLTLPVLGGPAAFDMPLPDIQFDYDLGGNSSHNLQVELDFDNAGAADRDLNGGMFGSLTTDLAAGWQAGDLSYPMSPDTTLGFDVGVNRYHIADRFTVAPNTTATLDDVAWPVYQPNSGASTPLSAALVRIWRGVPGAGGVVVAGNMTTNRLIKATSADLYRVSPSNMLDNTRAIKHALVDLSWAPALTAGEYWIEFVCEGWTGPNFGNVFAPPNVWAGQTGVDRARRYTVATGQWAPLTDATSLRPLSFPFHLYGSVQSLCPADINGSGVVDIDDLLQVIANWGSSGGPADVNHDGNVNIDDLLEVIQGWGTCL